MNEAAIQSTEQPRYDLMGWGDPTLSEQEKLDLERRRFDVMMEDTPIVFRSRGIQTILPEILKKFEDIQEQAGFSKKSRNLTLLDQLVLGRRYHWKPQIIGSCVLSNTFRGWVRRGLFQIAMLGNAEEYLGRDEFGPNNIAPYGPFTYGCARKRGNMRGGDGLYASAMAEALLKDGVLMCNSPKLLEILKANNVAKDEDFPEPQSKSFYRAMGDWKYLDELKPFADFRLLSCPKVTSYDDITSAADNFRPIYQCSSIAIKKIGTHKDGFPIFGRNRADSWAHNMGIHGYIIASDGDRFDLVSNESWGDDVIYPVHSDEVRGWYNNRICDSYIIDEIDMPDSVLAV